MTAWPGFGANAKAAKSARQTPFILCALAPLRLCVDFFRRSVAGGPCERPAIELRGRGRAALPRRRTRSTASLPFFLESVPAVSAKLKEPNTKDEKFEDVVKSAQDAAVLVLVY